MGQNYARKYQLPIDTVAFDFAILRPDEERKATAEKIPDGSVCHGLFFEGARWDVEKHVIAESPPRELYTTCPMFHMQPKVKGDIEEVIGRPGCTRARFKVPHTSTRYRYTGKAP